MSLLVTRQCLHSRSALRACVRPLVADATRRCYASRADDATDSSTPPETKVGIRSKPRKHGPRRLGVNVAPFPAVTVIPHSLHQDDATLLGHMKSLPIDLRADKQRFCVILATPAFAPRLRNPHFVAEILDRMHRRTKPQLRKINGLRLQALCAVVDKLPVNMPHLAASPPTLAAAGFEGIAYVSLPPMCSVPSEGPSSTSSASAAGAIDFIFPTPTSHDRPAIQRLRLPLANTLFHTGTPTTMFLSVYTNLGSDNLDLNLESTTPLAHHGVRIDPHQPGAYIHPDTEPSLAIPLLPLTEQRCVKASMGNIVRRIVGPDSHELTASSELEDAVPRFFKARDETPQAITAWALVVPSAIEVYMRSLTHQWLAKTPPEGSDTPWETMWRQDPRRYEGIVRAALTRGARLHRVLSGGGGWGQKAGLLSLDPVPANDFAPLPVIEHPINTPAEPTDFASTLIPVINDGDFIQFFVQPTSYLSANISQHDAQSPLKTLSEKVALGWELGTVPSTVDTIPGQSWQHRSSTARGASTFTRSFGALSEGPLKLTQYTLNDPVKPVTTTVDVPFTRLTYFCGMPPLEQIRNKQKVEDMSTVDHNSKKIGRSRRAVSIPSMRNSQKQRQPRITKATTTPSVRNKNGGANQRRLGIRVRRVAAKRIRMAPMPSKRNKDGTGMRKRRATRTVSKGKKRVTGIRIRRLAAKRIIKVELPPSTRNKSRVGNESKSRVAFKTVGQGGRQLLKIRRVSSKSAARQGDKIERVTSTKSPIPKIDK